MMKAQRCMSILPANFQEIANETVLTTETGIRVVVPIEGHLKEMEEEDEEDDDDEISTE